MPTHNAAQFLVESIESILKQSFTNFEYLIIDNASTDGSNEIIASYAQKHACIRVLTNKHKKTLPEVRNQGLRLAKGKYIAKMDADDVSLPHRFEKQVALFEQHPKVVLCGTGIQYFRNKEVLATHCLTNNNDELQCKLLFENCFVNSSVMMKNKVLQKYHLQYDSAFDFSEDYHLWTQFANKGQLAIIPEVLCKIRLHNNQESIKHASTQQINAKKVQSTLLQYLELSPVLTESNLHYNCCNQETQQNISSLSQLSDWLFKLHTQNHLKQVYPEPAFTSLLKQIWLKHTAGNTHFGQAFFKLIRQNSLSEYHQWSCGQKLKFWVKCFLKKK